jgi:hypothetical protein
MLPIFIVPVVIIWGGVGAVSFGKYIYKKCAYWTISHKLTAPALDGL